MLTRTLTLQNKLGLHARAAMKLSELALRFSSTITITYNNNCINAKSILNLMVLGASFGQEIKLHIDGDDEEKAMEKISALINDRFGEGE